MTKFEQIVIPTQKKYLTTYLTALANQPKFLGCLKKNQSHLVSVVRDFKILDTFLISKDISWAYWSVIIYKGTFLFLVFFIYRCFPSQLRSSIEVSG